MKMSFGFSKVTSKLTEELAYRMGVLEVASNLCRKCNKPSSRASGVALNGTARPGGCIKVTGGPALTIVGKSLVINTVKFYAFPSLIVNGNSVGSLGAISVL